MSRWGKLEDESRPRTWLGKISRHRGTTFFLPKLHLAALPRKPQPPSNGVPIGRPGRTRCFGSTASNLLRPVFYKNTKSRRARSLDRENAFFSFFLFLFSCSGAESAGGSPVKDYPPEHDVEDPSFFVDFFRRHQKPATFLTRKPLTDRPRSAGGWVTNTKQKQHNEKYTDTTGKLPALKGWPAAVPSRHDVHTRS